MKNWKHIVLMAVYLVVFFSYRDPPVQSFVDEDIKISESADERFVSWKMGLKMFAQHPFMGSGIGHWKVVFKNLRINNRWMKWAHNEFIQTTFEMGIGFLFLLIFYLRRAVRNYRKETILSFSALAAICANSVVNFPFHIAQTAVVAVTWLAILEGQNAHSSQGNI